MGSKEVTMETKYAAVFASVQAGRESVTEVCARLGISRKSYYKYLARFRSEGLEGLRPRSRRPLTRPSETPPEMVGLITTARADLAAVGWDNERVVDLLPVAAGGCAAAGVADHSSGVGAPGLGGAAAAEAAAVFLSPLRVPGL